MQTGGRNFGSISAKIFTALANSLMSAFGGHQQKDEP
jgi:hypothetical protein